MKKKIMKLPSNIGNCILKRGDVYYANLCGLEQSLGSEQTGRRPVLVIQNDIGNLYSPTTIVAILTTKIKRNLPTHVVIRHFKGLSETSVVCLEHIKTIDKIRLEDYRGNIGDKMMKEIEKAIFVSLGTKENNQYEESLVEEYAKEVFELDLVRKDTDYDRQENNWLAMAQQQLKFFSDIKQYMVNLKIVKSNLENEIEDILDYIESTNFNVVQAYKIYKMLRERRKQRKKIISELHQLEALTERFDCEQMRSVYQSSIAKMQQPEIKEIRTNVVREFLEQEVS